MRKFAIAVAALLASTALAQAAGFTGVLEVGGGSSTINITNTTPLTGTIQFIPGSTVLPVANGTSGTFAGFVGDAVIFPSGTNNFNTLTSNNPFVTIDATGVTFNLATETVSQTPIGGGNFTFDISGTGTFMGGGLTATPGTFTYSTQSIGGVFQNTSFSASANAVPGPIVGAGLPGLVSMMLGGGVWWRKRRKACPKAA